MREYKATSLAGIRDAKMITEIETKSAEIQKQIKRTIRNITASMSILFNSVAFDIKILTKVKTKDKKQLLIRETS